MTSLEDRLRDAFRAYAETVRPHTVRDLGDQAARTARRQPSRRRRLLVPLAAAATVAAVAVAAAIVAPRLLPNPAPGSVASVSALAYPGGQVPAGPPPKFYVAILYHPTHRQPNGTELGIFSTATGRMVGHILAPAAGQHFQAVTALGNDRTFVADAGPSSSRRCGTWLYELRLTPHGAPASVTPFVVPFLTGNPAFGEGGGPGLSASAGGKTVAFDVSRCKETKSGVVKDAGRVGVIRLPSGQITAWTYKSPALPGSLSLSADGSLLGMISNPSTGTRGSSSSFNRFYTLRTDSAPGQIARHYRKIVGPTAQTWPQTAALSPTGAVGYVGTLKQVTHRGYRLILGAYQTATGRLIRVLHVFPVRHDVYGNLGFAADSSGRYLLLYLWTRRLQMVDLATGQTRFIPGIPGGNANNMIDVAW